AICVGVVRSYRESDALWIVKSQTETNLLNLNLKRAADAAYGPWREKILSGDSEPGQRVDVAQIAQRMGVSPTPVKDALQKLSIQGLVEIRARKGTFVTKVGIKDLEESFDVREALELKACQLLSGKLSRQQADHLRQLNQRLKECS